MIDLADLKNNKVDIDKIVNALTLKKNVSLSILRLDKIHPQVSGNKFFKLYYFLEEAIASKKKIITFSSYSKCLQNVWNKLYRHCKGRRTKRSFSYFAIL
jgi:1-aminocyclopropane-1-carboxylate deaminase/D-cysteine desulfhydrase-like pyridoxal-dependent ACC family enzyme